MMCGVAEPRQVLWQCGQVEREAVWSRGVDSVVLQAWGEGGGVVVVVGGHDAALHWPGLLDYHPPHRTTPKMPRLTTGG